MAPLEAANSFVTGFPPAYIVDINEIDAAQYSLPPDTISTLPPSYEEIECPPPPYSATTDRHSTAYVNALNAALSCNMLAHVDVPSAGRTQGRRPRQVHTIRQPRTSRVVRLREWDYYTTYRPDADEEEGWRNEESPRRSRWSKWTIFKQVFVVLFVAGLVVCACLL